ncbi:MAG TPA: YhdP family protein [Oxalicibacterium sp.]|nr:YhdP family protein [Oxalicibacterium sp.]
MSSNQRHPAATRTADRLRTTWRLIRRGVSRADAASFHALRWLLRLLVLSYFVFCALFLGLRYAVLPHIDAYRADVEQMASRAIGLPVTIGSIGASWQGLRPQLSLTNVAIHDRNGDTALQLPAVSAVVSWWSVPAGEVRLQRLEIQRPDLDVQRDAQGNFFVAGLPVKLQQNSDGRAADWVLRQHEIVIVDGKLRWRDDFRKAPPLALDGVSLLLRNSGRKHRFALKAVPPTTIAAPLDVRALFVHPHFSKKISDATQWSGEVYADLRDADLAAWKTYVDFPFDLQQATGSMRAWLSFDHARVVDFTADLGMRDVAVQWKPELEPLRLNSVNGRMSVRDVLNGSAHDGTLRFGAASFGTLGHMVSLVDFTLQTNDGLVLPKTTVSERYLAPQKGQPERTEVQIKQLDLQTLADFAGRLPLTDAHRRMLNDFAPRGRLTNFSAQWQGSYPALQSYRIAGQFDKLAMQAQPARPGRPATPGVPAQAAIPAIPGFANLSGRIDADNHGGALTLASQQLMLSLPTIFQKPNLQFDTLKLDAKWALQKNDELQVNLRNLNFTTQGMSASLAGTQTVSLAKSGHRFGMADMHGALDGLPLDKVGDYLPLALDEQVRNWLTHALAGGSLHDGVIRLKGDLARFPFHAQKPNDKNKGVFLFSGRLQDGVLNYTPGEVGRDGKAPMWPLLEKIKGGILFDRTRMEITADTAATHGAKLTNVKAVVPDLLAEGSVLQIDGHAAGSLQDLVQYTVDSPVAGWIGHFTDETKASGDASLALKLQLPLHHMSDAKVLGVLKFDNNSVTLQNAMPAMTQANGTLEFNESGVQLKGIKASFLGGPLTVAGGSQKNGDIVIKADGSVSAAGLRKAYPGAQKVVDDISGSTRFATVVAVRNGHADVSVESNLRGLGLNLPVPLRKAAADAMPLKFELTGAPSDNTAVLRDRIKLSLGNAIAAGYVREKNAGDISAAWRVVRGGIGINTPAPEPDSGVVANVSMPTLNVDDWIGLASLMSGGGNAQGGAQSGTSGDADISQYVVPNALAARATELIVLGKKLDQVVLGASQEKGTWQVNIDSTQAAGYLTWIQSSSGRGLGKVTARLASLIVPRTVTSDVKDLMNAKDATTEMPALDIVAEQFQLFDKKLGRLDLTANYVRAAAGREWRIRNLALTNPDAVFSASGSWLTSGNSSTTNLDYKLTIADAGHLLERFGYAGVLRGGKGKMDGTLRWQGAPFSFDEPSLSGSINLDMEAGQFLKVEPGAAKLLGVLSLQSLPRRLTLDFRDVFSQGFAFDSVTGNASIENGVATTDNFKMRGVNAAVLMDGKVDIDKETQDLRVVVIPEINAGAASVVYGLAINPVIGVGTFLAQLLLRAPLAQAFTFEYTITGPWSDPTVTKVDRKNKPTVPPASRAAHAVTEG